MIVFARGAITNGHARAPHRDEELWAVAQLKADGVVRATCRRTAETGCTSFSRDPASMLWPSE
jgi:hypothetical protein